MDFKETLKNRTNKLRSKQQKLAQLLNLSCAENIFHLLGIKKTDRIKCQKEKLKSRDKNRDIFKEKIYRDSTEFLKGTITENPQNDYSQYFVDKRERPQNFIIDTSMSDRYMEYPKLKELMRLKDELVAQKTTPPLSLKTDLRNFDLKSLGNIFDVILIQPPLIEYQNIYPEIGKKMDLWSWEEIANLDIDSISSSRSFVFLWCGSYDGLEHGRACFRKWGYRRCEDVCWVKSNLKNKSVPPQQKEGTLFLHTKEHLLMGIKGTIRRSSDYEFIHSNVDLDVIVTEEPIAGSLSKPEEVFYIIEHFCMSRRRLHLFGEDNDMRPGWVTVGPNIHKNNFDSVLYAEEMNGDNVYIGKSNEIEVLRPKSPTQRQQNQIVS